MHCLASSGTSWDHLGASYAHICIVVIFVVVGSVGVVIEMAVSVAVVVVVVIIISANLTLAKQGANAPRVRRFFKAG